MSHYNPYGYPPTEPAYRAREIYPEDIARAEGRRLEHEIREAEAYGHVDPLRPAVVTGYPMDRHGEVRVDRHGDVIVEPARPMMGMDRHGDVVVETRHGGEVIVEPQHRREVVVEPHIDPYVQRPRYDVHNPVVYGGTPAYERERHREEMVAREVADEIRHEMREEAAYGHTVYGGDRHHGDKHHSEYREYRPY